jgi:hypothetical protein
MAIGWYDTDSAGATALFGERWDGHSWSLVPVPTPVNAVQVNPREVACASTTDCLLVGTANTALAEHWNGARWQIVPVPEGGGRGTVMSAVACSSVTNCIAVGIGSGPTRRQIVASWRWDGTRWQLLATPTPAAAAYNTELSAVACTSATNCYAVGQYAGQQPTDIHTLVEHWDGRAWTIQPSATPPATVLWVYGLTCAAPTQCIVVGTTTPKDGNSTPLAEILNGTTWTITPVSAPAGPTVAFNNVACATATTCTAVGYVQALTSDNTLIEHWNGHAWSQVTSPIPPGGNGGLLNAIACSGPTHPCVAIGGDGHTLIERGGP